MPEIEEVIRKADTYLDYYIQKNASYLSPEIKEDVKQIGFIRVIEAYNRLDPERGWKAFIQTHCSGTVLDYIGKSSRNKETCESDEQRDQVEGDSLVELGIFYASKDETKLKINWDLVSRMASKDDRVCLVARFILGHSVSSIARNSKMSRETISQKLHEFYELLEDPMSVHDRWVNQIIYAFGLCEHFHMREVDNGEGWDLEPIDIFASELEYQKKTYSNQMDLI